MNKSTKSIVFRMVSVLLAILIMMSANLVALIATAAAESYESAVSEVGTRTFTVVSSNVNKVYCYWWNNNNENGFVEDKSPATNGKNNFWNFSIPNDASGTILTTEDKWEESSDNEDIKLSEDLAIDPKLSNHIFINLAKSEKSISDFKSTSVKVKKQNNPSTVKPGEDAQLVSFSDFSLEGSLSEYIDDIQVFENENLISIISTDDTFTYKTDVLGKHTVSFGVKDVLNNEAVAEDTYTVYCKTDRGELSFIGETPVTMTFGNSASPLKLSGITTDDVVSYSVENESIAKIVDGKIQSVKAGNTYIIATVAENDKYFALTAKYELIVEKGNGKDYLKFLNTQSSVEVIYGTVFSNTVDYDAESNPDAVVTYTSDNEKVAKVSDDGTVKAVSVSDEPVKITAKVENLTNLTDTEISYEVIVKKADMVLSDDDVKSEEVVYSSDLEVDCSDNFKVPADNYSAKYEIIEQKAIDDNETAISGAGSIDENGIFRANRSGVFTIKVIVTSKNYNDKEIYFTVKVKKADRNDFFYENDSMTLNVGCSYDMQPPVELSGVTYSISDEFSGYAKLDGNKVTALKKNTDGIKVVASIAEDDCYNAAKAEFILILDYFKPLENPAFTVTGKKANENDDTRYVDDITITPAENYSVALYDENSDNNTVLDFKDSITINSNINNPRIVLRYEKAEEGLLGAVSDIIETNIFLDKTAPTGQIISNAFEEIFNKFLQVITFNLYTPSSSFEITAADVESGVFESGRELDDVTVQYYIDREAADGESKSVEDLDAIADDEWIEYRSKFEIKNENSKTVVYAKLIDPFGNYRYICTDGIVFDVTNPVVTVSFDNNDSSNGYFKESRTATIVVEEENFESLDGMIAITAKNAKGEAIEPPQVKWNGNTAEIIFDKEAEYTFDITDALKDKAGNARIIKFDSNTKYADEFVIDKTAPEVTVRYDNNENVNGYFKNSRKATITVDEDYFESDDGMINVTAYNSIGSEIPSPEIKWIKNEATVVFDTEGEYTLNVTDQLIDKAGNIANVSFADGTEHPNKFIVDNIKPIVELSFDNNNSDNGYFDAKRVATIKVKDNYFTPTDEMVVITAESASGEKLDAPNVKWTGNTATIEFAEDAHYTLEITDKLTDRAGNEFSDIAYAEGTKFANDFIVDTTNANATISFDNNKVSNGKYYADSRVATITVDDDNFVGTSDMIVVTAKNTTGGDNAPEVEWSGNTAIIEFTEDGIYTIKATDKFKDLAQNNCQLECSEGTNNPYEFIIDKINPEVKVEFDNINSVNGNYFSKQRTAVITVVDNNFEADNSMINVSAKDVNGNDVELPIIECGGNSFKIFFSGDADYSFKFTDKFLDLAGNKYALEEGSSDNYSFCVDESVPEYLQIEYIHSDEGLAGTFAELIELFTGGIVCFPDEVTARITARDVNSGIGRIVYSAPANDEETGLNGIDNTVVYNDKISEELTLEFPIKAEYKGKIQAAAYNNADLFTQSAEGTVSVSEKKPEIDLRIINEEKPRFYNGKDYYKKNVVIRVTVEDVFFDNVGQTKKYLEERNNLVIKETTNNDETVLLDVVSLGWNRMENTNKYFTDITLTTEGDKKLEVSYRNNVGKNADDKVIDSFVIDKTKPYAKIFYDNNNVTNEKYYSASRTATVSVTDDYFEFPNHAFEQNSEDRMFDITATDINGNNVDSPKYDIIWDRQSAKVYFEDDANYTIKPTRKFTDIAGNQIDLKTTDGVLNPYEFCVDKSEPEALEISYTNNGLAGAFKELIELFTGGIIHFSDEVTVSITASDVNSGINKIEYSAPVNSEDSEWNLNKGIELKEINNDKTSEELSTSFVIPAEYKGKVVATAYNNAGLITGSDEGEIAVSEKKPEITLEIKNEKEPISHNNISYYKENVIVRVTVEDVFFDALGQRKDYVGNNLVIKETTDNEVVNIDVTSLNWNKITDSNKYYTDITLSDEGDKKFEVSYTNNVGKSADERFLDKFVIDKTAPVVNISFNNNKVFNGKYFNSARTATVAVSDDYFIGLNEMIKLTEKNKKGNVNPVDYKYSWSTDKQTATIMFENDAFYTFDISDKFVDLAGNEPVVQYSNETQSANDFVIDKTAPNELNIKIKEVGTENIVNNVKIGTQHKDSPLYCNKQVEIILTANDELIDFKDLKLEYSVDLSDGKYEKTAYENPINIEPDRYFVVTAYVEDKAGNKTQISSDKIILDKTAPEIDGISPDIKLNVNSNNPKIDKNGETLYNGNVVVDYVITDRDYHGSCSGLNLDELKYSVFSNGVQTQNGTLSGSTTQFDGRIQSLTGSIIVDANKNNSNNVEVIVYAKDNADNPAEDSAKLRIDITNPSIDVSYTNNNSDRNNTQCFNNTRRATIQITERNFNEDKVVVKATKNGSEFIPSLSWTHTGNSNDDSYVHTAYVDYNDDADYTFDISYTDEASNPAQTVNYGNSVSPTKFTIDKTAPIIEVAYDYNTSTNGNYYNQHRIATVTIIEHNFDQNRVTYSCNANDNGKSVTAPALSGWSNSGDIHTATISFNTDAHFVMNISVNDMAGNAGNTVPEQNFYVDTTKPEIKIEGIENNSANNGSEGNIGFTLTTSDHNLDSSSYDMKLNRIDVDADDNRNAFKINNESRTETQIVYTENNLESDGIYKLTCEVSDKAGNHTTTSEMVNAKGEKIEDNEFLFSVNRLGSTFMVDEETQQIVDKGYIKEVAEDIFITEINPDKVDKYVVSLTKGTGKSKTLNEGDNYTRIPNDSKSGNWKSYTYKINKSNFEEESAYSLAIITTDKAENVSYSETNNPEYSNTPIAKVNFVVDHTIPQVVVNNLEDGGHYNVDTQTVDIIANDDNLLVCIKITLNDELVKEYTEEELSENGGKMSLDIASSESLQNLKIEAVDAANNSTSDSEDTTISFVDFLVTTNIFIQFINNPVLVILSAFGILLIAGLIIFIVALRRKKKENKQ